MYCAKPVRDQRTIPLTPECAITSISDHNVVLCRPRHQNFIEIQQELKISFPVLL
jgi:hypothetical protein